MITYHVDAGAHLQPGKAVRVHCNGDPSLIGILGLVQDSGCAVRFGGTQAWFTREDGRYVYRQIEPTDEESQ